MTNIESDGEIVAGIGVVSYIDNDAARSHWSQELRRKTWLEPLSKIWRSLRQSMGSYLGSVGPGTESNLADEPSRFATERVKELGFADKSGLAVKVTDHFFFKLEGSLANEKEGSGLANALF